MEIQKLSAVFKALGDESRLRILEMIAGHDNICACDLLEAFDFTQPTLSHHIKILCSANLIHCQKQGRWMRYHLNTDTVKWLRNTFEDLLVLNADQTHRDDGFDRAECA